jgi:integrase
VKDGVRQTSHGEVQRFYCKDCGYRFSLNHQRVPRPPPAGIPHSQTSKQRMPFRSCYPEKNIDIYQHVERIDTKILRLQPPTSNRRVCDERSSSRKEHGSPVQMKHHGSGRAGVLQTTEDGNLVKVETRQKRAAGATETDPETTKGLITKFMAYLDKEGYRTTAYLSLIRLLAIRGADLLDPEDVKEKLAKQLWKDSVKLVAVSAYKVFAKVHGVEWTPPRYKPEDTLPFVPEESELDQLIATCKSRRMAAYLQTLKETSADPTEALRIEWIDKDDKNRIISIRHPVKGHDARQRKVSGNLTAMLNALPKKSEQIFATNYSNMETCFLRVRKRAAKTLQNPRLLKISFRTFRHWGGSMIAHYTHGNVLAVKRALGHKRIENTMKYIHMLHFKDDEFHVATATSVGDVKKLAAAGFEKIDEIQGIHVFRRPKRFGA